MSNDQKYLPINLYLRPVLSLWKIKVRWKTRPLLTVFDALCDVTPSPAVNDSFCKTKLNGIFRVALKAISWASGVELNYTKKR